jgi:hypothetical protein
MKLGAALTDHDVAGDDGLAAEFLDAEALSMTIAPIESGGLALLMCHGVFLLRL